MLLDLADQHGSDNTESVPSPRFAFQGYAPRRAAIAYRDHLPHMRQEGVIYFITFRLADSVPHELVCRWERERDQWLRENPPPHTPEQERKLKSLWAVRIENALDRGIGSCPLRQVAVRQGLERTLRHDDGKAYLLGEFVIMPNHVHLLVRPELGVDLGELMQTWKSVSAHRANVLLDRSGTFWQDEYFDHIVRDIPEWQKAGRYVRENPRRLRDGDFTSGCGMLGSAQEYLLACQSASGALSAAKRA